MINTILATNNSGPSYFCPYCGSKMIKYISFKIQHSSGDTLKCQKCGYTY